jgi:Crinkler effector protein N-terminal domain
MFDTPVPSQHGSRQLNCLIEGESIIFTVFVGRDWNIRKLKKEIKKEREMDVDPHTLEL